MVRIALCLMALTFAIALIAVAGAHAANYKMLLCAGNNGSNGYDTATNTTSSQNPGGIFSLENHCGPAPDPAGDSAFLRIAENQSGGNAGVNAYGSISWTVPPWVAIIAGGGYTREPNAFNDGWRGRFWAEGWDGSTNNILMQGTNTPNSGIEWGTTSTFASHLWPFGGYGDYRRFVFELTCFRPAGCDRANFNAVDANTIVLTLADRQDPKPSFVDSATVRGEWVRGYQPISWYESDQGSGLRFSRLKVDNATLGDGTIDYQANGGCDTGWTGSNGEFARRFNPCTGGPYQRWYGLEAKNFADGQHSFAICLQDYGQYRSGGESCDSRTIHTDNTAPGKPAELRVTSANPERYLDHFGAGFSLPPNQGSPIAKVHYDVVDAAGKTVMPEKVLSATNPTALSGVEGLIKPGAYSLRVWLEDQVGLSGPPAVAEIPRDTTPPAAPQGLSVAAPTTPRAQDGFDLRWRNIADSGSPIDAAHYQVLNGAGAVVVPTVTVGGDNPEAIESIEAPNDRGSFTLRLWLTDAEGNVGAPVTAPLSYECLRSTVGGGQQLSADLDGATEKLVEQGQGATLRGELRGTGGDIAGAPLCVFSQVAGEIPGPRNDDVVIVLQVKQGDGWLAFRRYRTREGGRFEADYLFRRTIRPTTYEMRAQVRETTGYPYMEGDSDPLFLRVLPKRKAHKACPAGKHLVKRRGKARCVRRKGRQAHGRHGRPDRR